MPHRLPRLLAAALLAAPALGELDRRRTSDKTHWSCSVLVTSGRGLHESEWQAMPSSDLSDGRPAFTAVVGGVPLYLRHEVLDAEAGDAAWVVSRSPARGASRSTWSAYAQSWAVGPHMVADIHADHGVGAGLGGAAGWHVPRHEGDDPDYGEWERASPQPAVYCAGPERGVHMSIPPDEAGGAHETSGFYLETGDVQGSRPVFSNGKYYLYAAGPSRVGEYRWMIGAEVDSTHSLYFAHHTEAEWPGDIEEGIWHRSDHMGGWVQDPAIRVVGVHGKQPLLAAGTGDGSLWVAWLEARQKTSGAAFDPAADATLPNGVTAPLVGLGTGGLRDPLAMTAAAVRAGYRSVDTAQAYFNEAAVGQALEESPAGRDAVFVQTKVWPTHLSFASADAVLEASLRALRTEYVDSVLLHWPDCHAHLEWMDCSERDRGTWRTAWRALERAYAEGRARAIGVSNFDASLLAELLEFASVAPHVVQNFLGFPYDLEDAALALARKEGIFFQAYAALRTPAEHLDRSDARTARDAFGKVGDLAAALGRGDSAFALLTRYLAGKGVGTFPRTNDPAHLAENLVTGGKNKRAAKGKLLAPEDAARVAAALRGEAAAAGAAAAEAEL